MAEHVIEQGECLSSVAGQYGFDWSILWDHPQNADLKKQRKDPNVLFPGDLVFIPEKQIRKESCATGARHRFVHKGALETLRLRLLDELDRPRAQIEYQLIIDGQSRTGTTNGDGEVVEQIGLQIAEATLILGEGDEITLRLGSLDPLTTTSGVQARLANLGYDPGPCDGILGPRTQQALLDFQDAFGLDLTGEVDDETQSTLQERCGR